MAKVEKKHPNEHFEAMYRRFKRLVEKDGIIQEVRDRQHYEKPSIIRKRARAAAKKRMQRQNESELLQTRKY